MSRAPDHCVVPNLKLRHSSRARIRAGQVRKCVKFIFARTGSTCQYFCSLNPHFQAKTLSNLTEEMFVRIEGAGAPAPSLINTLAPAPAITRVLGHSACSACSAWDKHRKLWSIDTFLISVLITRTQNWIQVLSLHFII